MSPAIKKMAVTQASQHREEEKLSFSCWRSSLFDETFLLNDVPRIYSEKWELEEARAFQNFCQGLIDLFKELEGYDFDAWTERSTINLLITKVIKLLGYADKCSINQNPWVEDESVSVKENKITKSYKPDLLIVNDPLQIKYIQRKSGKDKLQEARNSVVIPIEAKYWGRIDKKKISQKEENTRADKKDKPDATRALDFDEQCLKYMEILEKEWGVLTDGRIWKLYNRELSCGDELRYYQFNLGHLRDMIHAGLDKNAATYNLFIENAKYFYHFFSKEAVYSSTGKETFLNGLLKNSKKYVSKVVEEDLKLRFVNAMGFACNGFQQSLLNSKEKADFEMIRNVSESHLFNILFIRYCESKNILPLRQNPNYRKISLSNTFDKLEQFDPEKEEDDLNFSILQRMFAKDFAYDPEGTELYERTLTITQQGFQYRHKNKELYDNLWHLTKVVRDGDKKLNIYGFRETIFSDDEWNFAQKHKLTNQQMVRILFELGYSESTLPGKKYQQIPYNFFSPKQLGFIYESFLEFKLKKAHEDMALIQKKWQPANLESQKMKKMDVPKVKKGNLFFSPDNIERKMTGAYYTPDYIVKPIVKETLTPLVEKKSSEEILNLKVCDPAMGSGHFLSSVLNFLARKYLEAKEKEINDDLDVSLLEAKKLVLHNCIYGVDINPSAVKLAKMSLWLQTADSSEELEHLDDQMKCADSLTNEALWRDEWKFLEQGLDAVVGNPPYLGEKGHKEIFQKIVQGRLGKRFYLRRMDIFYFFFHLGLDILKDNGRLGFITTNYFITARGAKKLRQDFYERCNLDLLLNLNELKIFGEASGQHNMITILSKNGETMKTKIINSNESGKGSESVFEKIYSGLSKKTSHSFLEKNALYDGDEKYIRVNVGAAGITEDGNLSFTPILEKIKKSEFLLKEIYTVNQGIVTGADKVSPRHLEKYKTNAKKGDGIFVMNRSELKNKNISTQSSHVKPWFKNHNIQKFSTSAKQNLFVLYFKDLKKKQPIQPQILRHFEKFKPLLVDRLTVCKKNKFQWNIVSKWINRGEYYLLFYPRKQEVFEGPKIVCPQRSKLNTFGYNEVPWYAASDVFFITPSEKSNLDLKYSLGLLNSKLYFCWLYFRGKRKGENLELIGKPLSEIPIKDVDNRTQGKVISICNKLIKNPDDAIAFKNLNSLVYKIYGLTEHEIKMVEVFYDKRVASQFDERKKGKEAEEEKEAA